MRIDSLADRAMAEAAQERARHVRLPWRALLAALTKLAGGKADLLRHDERPWASITFSGTRHTVSLTFVGADAVAAGEVFIAALPEHEFELPGQVVIEATVAAAEHTLIPEQKLTIEAELLLLEDS